MKEAKTALKIVLPFIVGIILSIELNVSFVVAFTLWGTFLLALLFTLHDGVKLYALRFFTGMLFIITFLMSGALAGALVNISNTINHYSHSFLPGDHLLIKIEEYSEGKNDFDKIIANVASIYNHKREKSTEGKLLVYIRKNAGEFGVGDKLLIKPSLQQIENKNNPGEFDQEKFWKNKDILHTAFLSKDGIISSEKGYSFSTFWVNLRSYLKQELSRKVNTEQYELATALSLGDKSLLSRERSSAFANAGAMHVLAVSGLHVGILLGIIQWICFRTPFLRKKSLSIVISIIAIWSFAFLTGLSPSVFRAALMFSILAVGQLFGMKFFSINSLLISALFLLIIDPFYLYDMGFQLSYLAMLGITFFYNSIRNLVDFRYKLFNWLWSGTALGIAAQIGTIPISLYYFHQFPNYFLITNIGLIVLSGIALGSVLFFFVVHAVPFIGDWAGELINFIFFTLIAFVDGVNMLPATVAKGFSLSFSQVIVAYGLIFGIWIVYKQTNFRKWLVISSAIFVFGLTLVISRFSNLNEKELIVFNHKYPVILVKERQELFCFYDVRCDPSNLPFLTQGYQQKKGGKVNYLPIKNSDTTKIISLSTSSTVARLKCTSNSYELEWNKKNVFIPVANSFKVKNKEAIIVCGYWSRFLGIDHIDFDCKSGAFRSNT